MQQDSDAAHEQIGSLEEQLAGEKRRREEAELEINKQKQVGRSRVEKYPCITGILQLQLSL